MKRTVIGGAVLALALGGVGVAQADPGPNGNNDYGLCKAYTSGQGGENGKKNDAPPFVALADEAAGDIAEYCGQFLDTGSPGNSGGKGKPE